VGFTFGVGRQAPTFTLPAADGSTVSLSDYRGDWLPVLVFFAVDDPQAPARLADFSSAAGALWGLRGQPVAIAVAEPEDLRRVEESSGDPSFPLLSDADGRVTRSYSATGGPGGEHTPLAVVVDRSGKIVWTGRDDQATSAAVLAAFRDVIR
jgi:peroxiredoxin